MSAVALMPGVEYLAIGSAAIIPDNGTISSTIAVLPGGRALNVHIRPVGTFDTIVISVQISNTDVAGDFHVIATSTAVVGELIIIWPVMASFMRIVVTSSTGASRTGLVIGVLA